MGMKNTFEFVMDILWLQLFIQVTPLSQRENSEGVGAWKSCNYSWVRSNFITFGMWRC